MDHSNLNLYKQDALNTAFDNMESFMGDRSVLESNKKDQHKVWHKDTGSVQEVPVDRNNGGNILNAKSDKMREVMVDMLAGDGHF